LSKLAVEIRLVEPRGAPSLTCDSCADASKASTLRSSTTILPWPPGYHDEQHIALIPRLRSTGFSTDRRPRHFVPQTGVMLPGATQRPGCIGKTPIARGLHQTLSIRPGAMKAFTRDNVKLRQDCNISRSASAITSRQFLQVRITDITSPTTASLSYKILLQGRPGRRGNLRG
jgi:hypothetical protein